MSTKKEVSVNKTSKLKEKSTANTSKVMSFLCKWYTNKEEPCNVRANTLEEIVEHQNQTHGRDYVCSWCGSVYNRERELKDHLESRHNVPKKETESGQFECKWKNDVKEPCTIRADTLLDIIKHQNNVHLKNKIYRCRTCNAPFKRWREWNEHRKEKHGYIEDENDIWKRKYGYALVSGKFKKARECTTTENVDSSCK